MYGPNAVTPLFDTERTEAEIKISTQSGTETHEGPQNRTRLVSQDKSTWSTAKDIPMPTENGGYTHTSASKAKISAANKGRTPWNKGQARSAEVRERIAAGVRAKNRERFLNKLEKLGLTEVEYEKQKKEERNKKAQERRARMTENGGFRPTEETRQKISAILKSKWAKGEMPRRRVDPSKVRSGFSHSEETRAKISDSLRKKWASDENYRESMQNKAAVVNTKSDMRRKISETLKAKWQEPEFREKMMERMRSRRASAMERDDDYRRKISEAMKVKWQDDDYRNKTMTSIRRRSLESVKPQPPRQPKQKKTGKVSSTEMVRLAPVALTKQPKGPKKPRPREVDENGEPTRKVKKVKKQKNSQQGQVKMVTPLVSSSDAKDVEESPESPSLKKKSESPKKVKEPDGSIDRLRDERRDLYDLLYGDDEDMESFQESSHSTGISAMLDLTDSNLDTFDPYGLEDF